MKDFILNIKELIKKHKYVLIIIALALCLIGALACWGKSMYNANQWKKININNVTALTDSINYYKSKNGDLVAEKTLLIGDMDLLKIANKELADKIEDMKVNNPQQVVHIETVIENDVHDTVWMIQESDTTIQKEFDFSNKWRILSGNINLDKNLLSLSIEQDKVLVDYTLAIKDNKVYITSENPYVKYNEIQGLTLPKQKKLFSIGVGPAISYGYDFQHNCFAPVVGVSVGLYYNIFQF
jgi:hypothetical protein